MLVVDQIDHDIGDAILHLAINAFWINAVLHAITAAPGAKLYAPRIKAQAVTAEMMSVEH